MKEILKSSKIEKDLKDEIIMKGNPEKYSKEKTDFFREFFGLRTLSICVCSILSNLISFETSILYINLEKLCHKI